MQTHLMQWTTKHILVMKVENTAWRRLLIKHVSIFHSNKLVGRAFKKEMLVTFYTCTCILQKHALQNLLDLGAFYCCLLPVWIAKEKLLHRKRIISCLMCVGKKAVKCCG